MSVVGFLKYNKRKKKTIYAYLCSAKYRFLIRFIKPKYLYRYWGEEGRESDMEEINANYRYCYEVAKIVDNTCNKTKWESKCLVRALTAQRFLRYKGIHSTLYLGCAIKEGKMVAHAWLRCGEMYVTGGNGEKDGYAVVDRFYT